MLGRGGSLTLLFRSGGALAGAVGGTLDLNAKLILEASFCSVLP